MEMEITRGENAKTRLTVPVSGTPRLKLCQADLPHEQMIKEYAETLIKALKPLGNTLRCTIIMIEGEPRVMHGSVAGNPSDAAKLGKIGAFGPGFNPDDKGFRKPKPTVTYATERKEDPLWVHLLRNGFIATGAFALYGVLFTVAFHLKPGEIDKLPGWAHILYLLLVAVSAGWLATRRPRKYPLPQE